jgi:hypothetical protein
MPSTVRANARPVVHRGSGDTHLIVPDVCDTPPVPLPIPYPNIGVSADTSAGAITVRVEGMMPMVKSAIYTKTTGDEPGRAGGVLSGTTRAPAEFILYSFDIKLEGRNVCRVGDPMFHNDKNAAG